MNGKRYFHGSTAQFYLNLKDSSGWGDPVMPDAFPTLSIISPTGVVMVADMVSLPTVPGVAVPALGFEFYKEMIIPKSAPIGADWKLEWKWTTATGTIPHVHTELFTIFPEIIASDNDLRQITSRLAGQIVQKVLLDDAEIKDIALFPALQRYSAIFPLEIKKQYYVQDTTIIPYPDITIYGALKVAFANRDPSTGGGGDRGGKTGSLLERIAASRSEGNVVRRGSYGVRNYNPNGLQQAMTTQRMADGVNYNKATFTMQRHEDRRELELYAETGSDVMVTWIAQVFDTSQIKGDLYKDVIQLAQANLLYHFASATWLLEDNTADIRVNSADVRSEAERLESQILDKWAMWPTIFVIRPA